MKRGEKGVDSLVAASGVAYEADLYVDSSGPRSLLLGETLAEPFWSYRSSLFCDRALFGTRERQPHEPIRPFTTAETMNAGWCYQVDHEERVALGYVYASGFLADDLAEREFQAKYPRVKAAGLVKFASGRRRNAWVQNVIAVGDASGFVEPLAASSSHVISHDASLLTEILLDSKLNPGPAARI